MSKRDAMRSFQDLDPRLFKNGKKGAQGQKDKKTPPSKTAVPAPDIADEAALFLAAVVGAVDVSLKNPLVQDEPVKKTDADADTALFMNATRGVAPSSVAALAGLGAANAAHTVLRPCPAHDGPEETNLFAQAMGGVAPINTRGRDIAPPATLAPVSPFNSQPLDDILGETLNFSLEYTDEYLQGHILGFDPLMLAKLKAGAFSPEGHIDLHGQNLEQAYATLNDFIKHAYQTGKRHLLLITGRGRNSPGGTGVLRERVQAWFTRDPFKRVVLAFCTAKPGDGGAGAVYVLLRKRKKSQGKIIWDRTPSEEELFFR